MTNQEAAEMLTLAIKKFADNPDNLFNMESYLSRHFAEWLVKFANTPGGMAEELLNFAEME